MACGKKIGIYSPEKADVFSLGMIFLQILTLKKLEDLNTFARSEELMKMVDSLQYDWAQRLLRPMLLPDYSQRPRFKDCFQYINFAMMDLTMERV